MGFSASVKVGKDKTDAISKSIKEFMKYDTLVGIPAEGASRQGEPINNAELLYIHTNGSPVRNIPPRPVIEPAIEDAGEQISADMGKAATMAIDGNVESAKGQLARAGMRGQNVSRAWFTNSKNGWAPNSAETIRRKGSSRPLIDHGELRKSITYVVRKGK